MNSTSFDTVFLCEWSSNCNVYDVTDELTWQCWSHLSPLQPGVHVHLPSRASQAPPLLHTHVRLQPRPQVPLGQLIEQSTPCHPKTTATMTKILKSTKNTLRQMNEMHTYTIYSLSWNMTVLGVKSHHVITWK